MNEVWSVKQGKYQFLFGTKPEAEGGAKALKAISEASPDLEGLHMSEAYETKDPAGFAFDATVLGSFNFDVGLLPYFVLTTMNDPMTGTMSPLPETLSPKPSEAKGSESSPLLPVLIIGGVVGFAVFFFWRTK